MHPQSVSDTELVDQFLRGNQTSFEILLKRHKQKIFSHILFMVRDRIVAEDIFQDTFLKAITTLRLGKYQDEGKFSAWVARIAHNLVIDYFRAEKHMPKVRDREEFSIFERMPSPEENSHGRIVSEEHKAIIREMINQLPVDQREVIVLRMYGDLSFKEIADITSVSINTALGRMRYAIINLRKMQKENNINLFQDAMQ